MRQALIVLPLLPFFAACTPVQTPAAGNDMAAANTAAEAPASLPLTARLRDASGAQKGTATVTTAGNMMTIVVAASGMRPGPKGLHIHETGKCEGPKFTSAGAHWNPDSKQHGRDNPAGAHKGDFANIDIAEDGTGSATFTVEGTTALLTDAPGKSIIIHTAADDYRTDPTGNSGDRMACGVFGE